MISIPELKTTPPFPARCPERWRPLWNAGWNLVQRSVQPPCGPLNKPWLSIGPGYFMPAFGHWDLAQSVLNIVEFAPNFAQQQIKMWLGLMRSNDDVLPGIVRAYDVPSLMKQALRGGWDLKKERRYPGEFKVDWPRLRLLHIDYGYVSPPLWPLTVIPIYKHTGDKNFLREAYEHAARNMHWWYGNRRLFNELFCYDDGAPDTKWESGYDQSPRWDLVRKRGMRVACVDASAHMGMAYESLAAMARALRYEAKAKRWEREYERLALNVNRELWDSEEDFFCDKPVEDATLQIKTVAGFWPMVAGQADEYQVRALVNTLQDSDVFGTTIPVPSVARNEPIFKLDAWRGPTWLSQTFWVTRGLRRYGHHGLASDLLKRAIDGAAQAFERHGTIFEFYHPDGGDQAELKRKGKSRGPCRDYLGHNPIHAMMFDWSRYPNTN